MQELIDIYDKRFEEEINFFADLFQDIPPNSPIMDCERPSNQVVSH
jgi:hypothetical protein